ncbi:SAF domain-containing protein [Agromyces arachidis]|uniref:SAF domain-containing protein n=1 Tax=Agromyces arachidis TaxID=766966 RepID=UPI004055FE73
MSDSGGRRGRGAVRLDPRLLIGLALVVGSTVGVWALVDALDDSREVLVAPQTLTPGTRIDAAALRVESVRLGGLESGYLAPADLPDGGLVVTRTVQAGELVPAASVAAREAGEFAVVVVPSARPLPADVAPGVLVDVWTAAEVERDVHEPPTVLVSGAEVARVVEADGMVTSAGPTVELLIPRDKTAAVLEALAAGDVIDLVPARAAEAG